MTQDNQALREPPFRLLLQGWGQFQAIHNNCSILMACSSVGHIGTTCLGHYKEDQYAFEATSFFGDVTHIHKNNQLLCRMTIVKYRTWIIEFYHDNNVVEIFKCAFNFYQRQYDVYMGLDGPKIIELIPKKFNEVQPKLRAEYVSNRSFADLFMAIGFILCKRKI